MIFDLSGFAEDPHSLEFYEEYSESCRCNGEKSFAPNCPYESTTREYMNWHAGWLTACIDNPEDERE